MLELLRSRWVRCRLIRKRSKYNSFAARSGQERGAAAGRRGFDAAGLRFHSRAVRRTHAANSSCGRPCIGLVFQPNREGKADYPRSDDRAQRERHVRGSEEGCGCRSAGSGRHKHAIGKSEEPTAVTLTNRAPQAAAYRLTPSACCSGPLAYALDTSWTVGG